MATPLFFTGPIEQAIGATVASRQPLVCFVTDTTDESNKWEEDYLADDAVADILRSQAITVRLVASSPEANYLNAFCAITQYPTLLIIKNGGAGIDGLTSITNPITKEDFITKVTTVFTAPPPQSILQGVNSNPTFPPAATPPSTITETPTTTTTTTDTPSASSSTAATAEATTTTTTQDASPPATSETTDGIQPPSQFPAESSTARRLASIQQQHRERIARLKAQREAAEQEATKQRELARREDTKAMTEAAETQKSRQARQYAEEQRKRKAEMETERRRVLEQIRADREEMKVREMNRKAAAAAAIAEEEGFGAVGFEGKSSVGGEKGKAREVGAGGECNLAFRLLDGGRVSHKFPVGATIEGDVRPWLDSNRTDGNHPYKLITGAGVPSGPSAGDIDGSTSLQDLGLYPSAILILKPITSSSKVSRAYATTGTGQHNFIIAFFLNIWMMIKLFFGIENPNSSVRIGERPRSAALQHAREAGPSSLFGESPTEKGKEKEKGAASGTSSAASAAQKRKNIRTLHDQGGDGADDKRSAYYNGNTLDFEPKPKEEGEAVDGEEGKKNS